MGITVNLLVDCLLPIAPQSWIIKEIQKWYAKIIMAEFNTGLPSVRLVQQWIKDKKEVEVKLSTNELLVGTLLWQDPQCIYLSEGSGESILVWRQTLVYLKPKG